MLDQQFSSQLGRFLATLMMADHRLVGAAAGHRIDVADCMWADAGASMMEGWTAEIYSRLLVQKWKDTPRLCRSQWDRLFSDPRSCSCHKQGAASGSLFSAGGFY